MAKALPLQGTRVANFGWVWAGPVVGQTLGFLGAEVYKIESRARIDLTRMLPPFAGGIRDPDRSISNHTRVAGPLGNRHPRGAGAPHGVFPCTGEDRWISIAVTNEPEWQGLVRAMENPEWVQATEFATAAQRLHNIHAL